MRANITILLFTCLLRTISAQEIVFNPKFGGEALQLGQYYKVSSDDSIQITALRFYISDIEFLKDGKSVWKEPGSHHLIDLENPESLRITLKVPAAYNQIGFSLGIDSLTNVSGAMGGDLDPSLGMYWTWQSGYINFKLEGKSNLCPTRNNEFQFHLGGYLPPFETLKRMTMSLRTTKQIEIAVDLKDWAGLKDLSTFNQIMSPSQDAVFLSERAILIFKIE